MKKSLFIVLMTLFTLPNLNAQISLGGGIGLNNGFIAAELKADVGLIKTFSLSGYLDYYINTPDSYSFMALNLDGHYNLGDFDSFNFYPLAGLNFTTFNPKTGSSYSKTYFQLGAGATYAITDNLKPYAELRYPIHSNSKVIFGFGVLFTL